MYMYMYIYAYIHVYIIYNTYTNVLLSRPCNTCTHAHGNMYVYMYVYIYIRIYIYIYICIVIYTYIQDFKQMNNVNTCDSKFPQFRLSGVVSGEIYLGDLKSISHQEKKNIFFRGKPGSCIQVHHHDA